MRTASRQLMLVGLTAGLMALIGCGGSGPGLPAGVQLNQLPGNIGPGRGPVTYTVTNLTVPDSPVGAGTALVTVQYNPANPGVPLVFLTTADGTFNNTPVVVDSVSGGVINGHVDVDSSQTRAVIRFTIIIRFLSGPNGTTILQITIIGPNGHQGGGEGGEGGDQNHPPTGLRNSEARRINRAFQALINVSPLLDAFLRYIHNNTIPANGYHSVSGSGPVITVDRAGNTLSLTFDYGNGTTNSNTGGRTVTGQAMVSYNVTTGVGVMTFNGLTVNQQAITGSITIQVSPIPAASRQTGNDTVTLSITIGSLGSVTGTMVVALNGGSVTPGSMTFNTTGGNAIQMADGSVTLANVVVSSLTNASWAPQAGTATITFPNNRVVVLTFNANTPSTGAVGATVNGTPVTFTVNFNQGQGI